MGDAIVDVDDIKDQLNLVVNELRSFVARLEDMKASNRDAMKNGPISEKEIKEHIMRKCRIYDIKSTNRGTVAGSNIEVSAACHILSSVGIIESFSENQKDKRGSRSSSFSAMENSVPDYGSFRDKYVAEKLLEILSARWGVSVSQEYEVPKSEPQPIPSTSQVQQSYYSGHDFVQPPPLPLASNDTSHHHHYPLADPIMDDGDMEDFVDIFFERTDSLIHSDFPDQDQGYGYVNNQHQHPADSPTTTLLSSQGPTALAPLPSGNKEESMAESIPQDAVARLDATNEVTYNAEGVRSNSSSSETAMVVDEHPQQTQPQSQPSQPPQHPYSPAESTGLSHFDHIPTHELLGGDGLEEDEEEGDEEDGDVPDYGEDNDEDDEEEEEDTQEPTILSYDAQENDDHLDHLVYRELHNKHDQDHDQEEVSDFLLGHEDDAALTDPSGHHFVDVRHGGSNPSSATTHPTASHPKQSYSRKSHSTSRIWRLKETFLLMEKQQSSDPSASSNPLSSVSSSVMINPLLSEPGVVLERWHEVNYEYQACLEIEEKMVRKLLSQCYDCHAATSVIASSSSATSSSSSSSSSHTAASVAKILSTNRSYQLGTKYLDSRYDGESTTSERTSFDLPYHHHPSSLHGMMMYGGDDSYSGSGPGSGHPLGAAGGGYGSTTQRKDLFDDSIALTGYDLIEKVRRNRRQRGTCLSSSAPSGGGSVSSAATYPSNPASSGAGSGNGGVHTHYLNNLKTVCMKAQQSYWESSSSTGSEVARQTNDEETSGGSGEHVEEVPSSSSVYATSSYSMKSRKSILNSLVTTINAQSMTLWELLRQLMGQNNLTVLNNSLVHTIVTNYGPNMMINGSFPNITLSTLRHYSFPLTTYYVDPSTTPTAASLPPITSSSPGFIQLTDLLITTLEIPWKSLVPEFIVVKGDDVMGIQSSTAHTNNNQNYLTSQDPDKEENEVPEAPLEIQGSPQFNRKRSHSRSFHHVDTSNPVSNYGKNGNPIGCKGSGKGSGTNSESIRNVMKGQVAIDVPAPTYHEIEDCTEYPQALQEEAGGEEDEEDTSDEAYLQNHDLVLRTMREKWALMQQLKVQTRRDSFSFPSSSSFPMGGGNRKSMNGQMMDSLRSPQHAAYLNSYASQSYDDPNRLPGGPHSKRSFQEMSLEAAAGGSGNVNGFAPLPEPPVQPVKKRGRPPKLQKLNHMHYGRVTS